MTFNLQFLYNAIYRLITGGESISITMYAHEVSLFLSWLVFILFFYFAFSFLRYIYRLIVGVFS